MNPEQIHHEPFNNRPEWLRIEGVEFFFGLKRTFVYELQTAGKIITRVLRKRGARKGVRLYSYDSSSDYIEANAEPEELPSKPVSQDS